MVETNEPKDAASRSEQTRKRILDAAQSLFAAHGFSATTTKAIAQRAGVPGGLVFYYFPHKKALLECIISERCALLELRTAVDALVMPDLRSTLITLGSRYLTILKQYEEPTYILLREFRSHPQVATQFRELHEQHIRLITFFLQEALQAGQYKCVQNVEAIARSFFYNIFVIAVIEDLPEPMRLVEEMVDILLCAVVQKKQ